MTKNIEISILLFYLSFLFVSSIENGFAYDPKAHIWISPDELAVLPMAGPAWESLQIQAFAPAGKPNLSDKTQANNIYILAKALVYTRCALTPSHSPCQTFDFGRLRTEAISQIMAAIGTEKGGETLALGRELAAYVIAADLVGLPPDQDLTFRNWLRQVRVARLSRKTLISTHEARPNNWGTHAGASRVAIDVYLGDTADLQRAAEVFRGWLGDRSAYAEFQYGSLSWQCHPDTPVGINPMGCKKEGHDISGVIPDDQRRSGKFTWPPPKENYVYEGLQGAIVQAAILHRAGYDPFNWSNKALLRAYQWLYTIAAFPAAGDDTWQMPLVDYFYETHFWKGGPIRYGKNMGWTDWTHAQRK